MSATQKFFLNQGASDPSTALVASFSSLQRVIPPAQFRDTTPTVELHFLLPNPSADGTPSLSSQPFIYDDPAAWDAVKFQVGTLDAAPDSGSFTLTDPAAGQTTGDLALQITAANLQTALRAALSTNYGACTVTQPGGAGTPYEIDRGATGAITALTGDGTKLAPAGSTVLVEIVQTGDSSHHAAFEIDPLRAAPAKRDSGWSPLPAALVTPSVQTAGSGTVNKTFRVVWNADAYSGSVFLSFTGTTVTQVVGPIAYNATAADVATAFGRHTDVGSAAGVAVAQNGSGDYSITCLAAGVHLSNTPALATSSNTLKVPVGVTAAIDFGRAGVSELLGSSPSIKTSWRSPRSSPAKPPSFFRAARSSSARISSAARAAAPPSIPRPPGSSCSCRQSPATSAAE